MGYVEKYNIIKQGIEVLENVGSIDDKTTVTLLKLLTNLSYSYYHKESIELIADTLDKYSYAVSKLDRSSKAKLLSNIQAHKEEIKEEYYDSIYSNLSAFRDEANEIISENEGVVVKIKDTYGFISNAIHTNKNALFFSKNNAYNEIKVGDKVSFELYTAVKGIGAKNIKKLIEN